MPAQGAAGKDRPVVPPEVIQHARLRAPVEHDVSKQHVARAGTGRTEQMQVARAVGKNVGADYNELRRSGKQHAIQRIDADHAAVKMPVVV